MRQELSDARANSLAYEAPESEERRATCKGYYFFVFLLTESVRTTVGKLGIISFEEGCYAYLGSSFLKKGVAQRVSRHLNRSKSKKRWHIDYLTSLPVVKPIKIIWECCDDRGKEPEISECLVRIGVPVIENFGSTDVKSRGHLFYLGKKCIAEVEQKISFCLKTGCS